jgi:PAS domain S-box-containing protein
MEFNVQTKLTSLLLAVAIIPIVIVGIFNFSSNKSALTDIIGSSFEIVAENIIGTIDRTIYERLRDTQFFITDSDLNNAMHSPDEQSDILESYLLNLGLYNQISLTDTEGTVVASTEKRMLGINVADEDWYERVEKRFIAASDYMVSPYTDKPTMILGNLLLDNYKNPTGVVFAELAWPVITELLETGDPDIEIILLNKDKDEIARSIQKSSSEPAWDPIIQSAIQDYTAFGVSGDVDEYLFALSPSDGYLSYQGHRWTLLMRVPSNVAFAQLWRISTALLLFTTAMIFTVLLIGSYASKRSVSSIRSLTRGAQRIQLGDLDQKITIDSKDEIGFLAQAFNEMASTVKKRNTQLVESLNNIERESQKYRTILENTKDAILLMNKDGKVVAANHSFKSIFGLSPDKLMGMTQTELTPLFRDLIPDSNFVDLLKEHRKDKGDQPFTCEIVTGSPQNLALKFVGASIIREDAVTGSLWIFRDITEEKEIERKKFEFVTIASHQIRTPLTAIRWNTELLKDKAFGDLNEEQAKALENIYASVVKTLNLADELLDTENVDKGLSNVVAEKFNLDDVLKEAMEAVSNPSKERNISINVFSGKSPDIVFNKGGSLRVIQNVLLNAIQYSEEGTKVKVTTGLSEDEQYLVLSVEDEGIGIPHSSQERVFLKFFRDPEAMKVETEGTGLGLYIAKKTMEASDGKITFESAPGKGSTFMLHFPVDKD